MEREQELLDALQVLIACALRAPAGPEQTPAAAVELVDMLATSVSDPGHAAAGSRRLGDVTKQLVPAREAGREVGLTGRQVRRLCSAGLVVHQVTRAGYEVDVESLRTHLAGGAL